MAELIDAVVSWPSLLLVLVVFGFLPDRPRLPPRGRVALEQVESSKVRHYTSEDFLYVFTPALTGRAARPERARPRSRSAPLGAPARAEAASR